MRVLLAVGLVSAPVLVLISGLAPWPETSSEYAAWLQAIGGVATLAAALLIASGEDRRHRRTERRAADDRRRQARSLARISATKLDLLLDEANQISLSHDWSVSRPLVLKTDAQAAVRLVDRIVPVDLADGGEEAPFFDLLTTANLAVSYLESVEGDLSRAGTASLSSANAPSTSQLFTDLAARARMLREHYTALAARA